MRCRWPASLLLVLGIALIAAQPTLAKDESEERTCKFPNAAGSVVQRAEAPSRKAGGKGQEKKQIKKHKKQQQRKKKKKQQAAKKRITLQAEPASANKVVNLGDDREAEEVTLHSSISPEASANLENQLGVVAEPFANTSETGETVTFAEPTFSRPEVSGNGKRVTFTMCVDAPNDLPAGKYTTTVLLEGPHSTEPAVMTVTLNAKDGHGFILAAAATALLSFLILLYKSAGEKRTMLLAEAEKAPAKRRKDAMEEARRWWPPIWSCLKDLGWWVPTVAAVGSAFAVLYAAYAANPAWGEGGIVTSAIALIGTGLAAVGAKAVFTQAPSSN